LTAPKLYKGADAALPGKPLPAGTQILCAYVGIPHEPTSPDAYHLWAGAEWNEYIEKQPDLRLLPIYVHNYADGHPTQDGQNAVAAVSELGWSANLPAPNRRFIVVDMETMIDPAYFYEMCQAIYDGGFRAVPYGSASTIRHNRPFAGYFVADYNFTRQPTTLPAGDLGLQWHNGTDWDNSIFSEELYQGCGTGLRRV
jgi:hypothetical protein